MSKGEPVCVQTRGDKVSFRTKKVRDKIRGPRSDAAAGPGGMELKNTERTSPALVKFHNSIDDGVVPGDWKEANVTPIFKRGKKCCPSTIGRCH